MATCCTCGLPRELSRDKSGRCRSCKSVYNREHYLMNKGAYVRRATVAKRKLRDANTARLRQYFAEHPCVDCGERDPLVLEFDHVEKKSSEVSRNAKSDARIATVE